MLILRPWVHHVRAWVHDMILCAWEDLIVWCHHPPMTNYANFIPFTFLTLKTGYKCTNDHTWQAALEFIFRVAPIKAPANLATRARQLPGNLLAISLDV